jgi:hypothetical protein
MQKLVRKAPKYLDSVLLPIFQKRIKRQRSTNSVSCQLLASALRSFEVSSSLSLSLSIFFQFRFQTIFSSTNRHVPHVPSSFAFLSSELANASTPETAVPNLLRTLEGMEAEEKGTQLERLSEQHDQSWQSHYEHDKRQSRPVSETDEGDGVVTVLMSARG